MVPVLITPTNVMRAVRQIRPAEMVTVEMAVTTTALQLSKNFNVVELIQADSDFSITEVLDHVVAKLHTIQTNTIVVKIDSFKLLEHALIMTIITRSDYDVIITP